MSSGPGGDREGIVNLGFARVDSARRERCGRPEVIFGAAELCRDGSNMRRPIG